MAEPVLSGSRPNTPPHAVQLPVSGVLPKTPSSITSPSNITVTADSDPAAILKAAVPGRSPAIPNLTSIASAGLTASPSPKSPKSGFSRYSPQPLTAAAAMTDERRAREERERQDAQKQSTNSANAALRELMGTQGTGMSRPGDAPTATTSLSEGMAQAAKSIQVPDQMQVDDPQVSPVSLTSTGTVESAAGSTATANNNPLPTSPRAVLPPPEIESRGVQARTMGSGVPADSGERSANRAFTFPGPLIEHTPGSESQDGGRGRSLPNSVYGHGSKSPSKKHKCPYCSTDFTRQHNLKSHLLTHSHEKPYLCQTCNSRFRRLHDLKRHTKLHTGERNHICHKCGRRFARGDALARHNKGQGGCAGRRASMGSYAGDDDLGEGSHDRQGPLGGSDDAMDGLLYTGDPSGEMERGFESSNVEQRRRLSLPSIKAHGLPAQNTRSQGLAGPAPPDFHPRAHHSTYPPAGQRPGQVSSGLYPPSGPIGPGSGGTSGPGPVHNTTSPNLQMASPSQTAAGMSGSPAPVSAGASSIFSGGMTESPKPISPGSVPHPSGMPDGSRISQARSPSISQQFQQQRYGRRGGGRSPPPSIGYAPPGNSNPPQLPSLPGLAPPDPRFTLPSQPPGAHQNVPVGPPMGNPGLVQSQPVGGPGMVPTGGTSIGSNSTGGSASSHGKGSLGSGSHSLPSTNDAIWAHIRIMEERMGMLQDEVTSLKNQLALQAQSHDVRPR